MAEHARGEPAEAAVACWTARKHSFVPLIKRPPTLRTKTRVSPETQLFRWSMAIQWCCCFCSAGPAGSFLMVVDAAPRRQHRAPGSQCPNCGLRLALAVELALLGWCFARPMPPMARHPSVSADGAGVAFAFVGVYQLAFDPFGCGGTMDPWLEATGARGECVLFSGVPR